MRSRFLGHQETVQGRRVFELDIQSPLLFFHLCRVLINIHTHLPLGAPDTLEVQSLHFGQVKNSVASAQSVGLHPWHVEALDWDESKRWLQALAENHNTVAIGEAGLDKVCNTPWEKQLQAFEYCISVSESLKLPLIIHCVRAFSDILHLKKRLKPTQAWIFHGFQKHPSIAKQCLEAGCYLSFGQALMDAKGHTTASFLQTSRNRLFLETDYSNYSISDLYNKAAYLLGIEIEELTTQIEENFAQIKSSFGG